MKLLDLVREALALESTAVVSDDDGPGTLEQWDSLAHIRLLAAIERSYGLKLGPDDVSGAASVRELKELLRRKGIEDP